MQGGAPAIFFVSFYCLKPTYPVSGTLPAKMVPQKLEIQGGAPAIFVFDVLSFRRFQKSDKKLFLKHIFTTHVPKSTQNQEKWVLGVTWELPGVTLGPVRKVPPKRSSSPPRAPILTPFWHFCFVRASWVVKKRGQGAPSKPDQVFGRFGDLPGG